MVCTCCVIFEIPYYFLYFRYLLNARSGKTSANGVKEDFGSIRVKVIYIKDHVFPSHVYNDLLQQLVSSVNVEVKL